MRYLRGKEPERAKINIYGITITAVTVMLLVLIGLSTRFYVTMKSFVSQDIQMAQKINEVEKKIDADALRTKSLMNALTRTGQQIDALNRRIKGQMARIEDLEKQLDGQNHALSSAVKVKNDLLTRITKLEEQSSAPKQ